LDPDRHRKLKKAMALQVEEILAWFRHTGDGAWAIDPEHRILFWNQAAEELLGYSAREAVGTDCRDLLACRDPEGSPLCTSGCPFAEQPRQGGTVDASALQVRRSDGRTAWLNVSIVEVPERDGGEACAAIVALFRVVGEGPWWAPPLRIHLLGPIVVRRAGGSLVDGSLWRRDKTRALFALLALQRGRPVHREILIEALWADLAHSAAIHNMNTTVYNLRRSLEPSLSQGTRSRYIHRQGDCYYLNGGRAHWLDLEAFEDGIALARQEPDPGRAIVRYRETLALYRGDLMSDLEPGLLDCKLEQERLRELHLRAREELATLYVGQQQDEEASVLYLQALADDPCREVATQHLMRLALRRGAPAEALTHYELLESALERELQILPSQETCLLYNLALQEARSGREPAGKGLEEESGNG
jgi:PAS domain S-box-containing protein